MKFTLLGPFNDNIYNLMRTIGYHFQRQETASSEFAFTRPRIGYPRLHLFVKMEGGNFLCTLHLDQKKPAYQGTHAHSGEYDGMIVENEVKRIMGLVAR